MLLRAGSGRVTFLDMDALAQDIGTRRFAPATATLVALHEGDALRIDSWLISWRIFSRSAEQFILRQLVSIAARMGAARVIGEYRPSGRNEVVAQVYPRLGFAPAGAGLFRREVARGSDGLATHIAAMAGRREAG
nr:hypothetical protein [uncultured Rhodopila sp.]